MLESPILEPVKLFCFVNGELPVCDTAIIKYNKRIIPYNQCVRFCIEKVTKKQKNKTE